MSQLSAKQRGSAWLRESQCPSPDLPLKVFLLGNCRLSAWRDVPNLLRFIYRDVLVREFERAGMHLPITEMALGPIGCPVPPIRATNDVLDAARFAQRMLREKADRVANVLQEAYEKPSSASRRAYTNFLGKLAVSRAGYDDAGLSRDWAPWVPAKRRGIHRSPKPGVYDVELEAFDAHKSYPPGAHVQIWSPEISPKRRLLCAYLQFAGGGRVFSWVMEGVYWTLPFLELLEFANELTSGRHDLLTDCGRRCSRIGKCPMCGIVFVRVDARQQHCSDRGADAARYKRREQRKRPPSR